jgi:nicotinate-nucleotide adenylyltransferase
LKTAIFGGTFNPIHNGHLLIANAALKQFGLDRILFIPTSIPPRKASSHLLPDFHRLQMVKLAVADEAKFQPLSIEVDRGGISYSFETVEQIKKLYPSDNLFFLLGSAEFEFLAQWYRIEELAKLCEFLVMQRPGSPIKFPPTGFPKDLVPLVRHQVVRGPSIEVSSSDIRKRLRHHLSVSDLLPEKVNQYILDRHLYLPTK